MEEAEQLGLRLLAAIGMSISILEHHDPRFQAWRLG